MRASLFIVLRRHRTRARGNHRRRLRNVLREVRREMRYPEAGFEYPIRVLREMTTRWRQWQRTPLLHIVSF